MRIATNRIASGLFVCSAVGPVGLWLILLFVGTPANQSAFQSASQMATFAFTESPAPWFFALLATLPLVFLILAVAAWRAPVSAWRFTSGLTLLAIASVALAVLVVWEVVFFAGPATYLLVSHRDG